MAKTDQFGFDTSQLTVSFPDLDRLEKELEARFGMQSLHCSADFALSQS